MNISERFDLVLAGRKPHSLEDDLNLPRNAISSLKKDKLPKPETLARLIEPERVNLDWLIAEAGAPFCVIHPIDATEAQREIDDTLAYHPGADLYFTASGSRRAVVITYGVKKSFPEGQEIEFTGVRVLAGVDRHAACSIDFGTHLVFELPLSEAEFSALVGGQMGNQEIFKLLPRAETIEPRPSVVREDASGYRQAGDSPEEQELLALFRGLDEEKRRQALELVRVICG